MAATNTLLICVPPKPTPKRKPSLQQGRNNSIKRLSSRSSSSTLCFQTGVVSSSHEDCAPQIVPFHPSIWGEHDFVATSSDDLSSDVESDKRSKELKKEVNRMLLAAADDPLQQMNLIDNIQRLGVAYHFESKIDDALQKINDNDESDYNDLFAAVLRFRLLRQAGYYVSPDVFEKFKDDKGEFLVTLSCNVQGLICLYEAAHLGFPGEDTLDEVIAFATHHLKSYLPHLHSSLAKEVQHALELPHNRCFIRLEARRWISTYQHYESRNETLLEFAKLDFNMVQSLHQKEIHEVSRWWKEVDIVTKLPFGMRDRIVEGYTMILAAFFEPKHSKGRLYMGKLFGIVTTLDDAYDVYGKIDKLKLLSDAILRWDIRAVDELPEYMKVIFVELLKLFNEIEEDMARRGQAYTVSYLKQQMQNYVKNLGMEAEYVETGHVPTLEEWFQVSRVTTGFDIFSIFTLIYSGSHVSRDALDWAVSCPKIATASSWICRLRDDISTFKLEQERGKIVSCVTCYMKEHGVSELESIENLRKIIKNKWKVMNRECLRPTSVPMQVLMISVNVVRIAESFYWYGDGLTDSKGYTKEIVSSLLLNPVPI